MKKPLDGFSALARRLSAWSGRASTFAIAVALILAWALSGPMFGFSDTWQLVVNTTTTIITFLMVFLIQNTQNRDTQAMQIKLDEIIRATRGSHNSLIDLEDLDEEELAEYHRRYMALAEQARAALERGGQDVDCPPVERGSSAPPGVVAGGAPRPAPQSG